ncbi:heavy metal-associated isoprenylated plant protein 3-like [Salvia miltiorrhiza]|uniref:heavy metal-associated isoprenylated plant protein 3-like n=1 Tax=Salvia miltiorrhiza TaxID=226208 RepID=UPI0025ABF687|nr:heavy metal-associated isoprenylated plant protein 3-like [Salvia miltiorrhiza]
MTEKNKRSNGEQQPKKEGTESKNKGGNVTVVLKADLHCEGCVSKVLKCIRTFDGVDTANIGDGQITVFGKVDPAKLRERVEKKTHKKIEVVSPQSKNGDGKEKAKGGGEAKKEEKRKESNEKKTSNKSDEKKSKEKEPTVTTAILKVHLHCEGCIQKIRRIVVKTKGYRDMKIDKQKETVTVTGAFDMKALAEVLKKHLKREVQIMPQKKEGENKENGKGGGNKGKSGGGGGGGGGDGDGGVKAGGGEKMEGNNNKMQFQVAYPYPYPYPIAYESGVMVDQFHYNPYAFGPNYAPQLFSDENPNACSVM